MPLKKRGFVLLLALGVMIALMAVVTFQAYSTTARRAASAGVLREAKGRAVADMCLHLATELARTYSEGGGTPVDFDDLLDPDGTPNNGDDYMPVAANYPNSFRVVVPPSAAGSPREEMFQYRLIPITDLAAGADGGACLIRFDDNYDDLVTGAGMSFTGPTEPGDGSINVPMRDGDRSISITAIGLYPYSGSSQADADAAYSKATSRVTLRGVVQSELDAIAGDPAIALDTERNGELDLSSIGGGINKFRICGNGGLAANDVPNNEDRMCGCGVEDVGSNPSIGECSGCPTCAPWVDGAIPGLEWPRSGNLFPPATASEANPYIPRQTETPYHVGQGNDAATWPLWPDWARNNTGGPPRHIFGQGYYGGLVVPAVGGQYTIPPAGLPYGLGGFPAAAPADLWAYPNIELPVWPTDDETANVNDTSVCSWYLAAMQAPRRVFTRGGTWTSGAIAAPTGASLPPWVSDTAVINGASAAPTATAIPGVFWWDHRDRFPFNTITAYPNVDYVYYRSGGDYVAVDPALYSGDPGVPVLQHNCTNVPAGGWSGTGYTPDGEGEIGTPCTWIVQPGDTYHVVCEDHQSLCWKPVGMLGGIFFNVDGLNPELTNATSGEMFYPTNTAVMPFAYPAPAMASPFNGVVLPAANPQVQSLCGAAATQVADRGWEISGAGGDWVIGDASTVLPANWSTNGARFLVDGNVDIDQVGNPNWAPFKATIAASGNIDMDNDTTIICPTCNDPGTRPSCAVDASDGLSAAEETRLGYLNWSSGYALYAGGSIRYDRHGGSIIGDIAASNFSQKHGGTFGCTISDIITYVNRFNGPIIEDVCDDITSTAPYIEPGICLEGDTQHLGALFGGDIVIDNGASVVGQVIYGYDDIWIGTDTDITGSIIATLTSVNDGVLGDNIGAPAPYGGQFVTNGDRRIRLEGDDINVVGRIVADELEVRDNRVRVFWDTTGGVEQQVSTQNFTWYESTW